jgi:hypothetical protein
MRTLNEFENLIVLFEGLCLLDKINLVLEDDDVLELHDLNGSQVLARLWLRARLVTGYAGHVDMKNERSY